MEEKMKPKYKDCQEWWRDNHPWNAEWVFEIALEAWDTAVQGTWDVAEDDIPRSRVGKFLLRVILFFEGRHLAPEPPSRTRAI
jgi:hypothetical protein